MKRIEIILIILLSVFNASGNKLHIPETPGSDSLKYVEASRFRIIGKIYNDSAPEFSRIPDFLKSSTRKAVWNLGQNSAGIAVRFRSNSSIISVKWENKFKCGNDFIRNSILVSSCRDKR